MKKAFTLLEILLVVAAIAILAGIVILAVNPGKQLGDTRNAQRRIDVNTILNAVYQYAIDNGGNLPSATPAIPPVGTDCATTPASEICKTGTTDCTGFVNLLDLTDREKYLVAIPTDPKIPSTGNGVGYHIVKDTYGRLTVCAPLALTDTSPATIVITR